MSRKDKSTKSAAPEEQAETAQEPETTEAQEPQATAAEAAQPEEETAQQPDELTQLKAQLTEEKEKYLRLAAEYDNFRKRSQREREALYTDLKAETTAKFLPVYDNLERALQQPTADEAYRKGVEMTMNQLVDVMQKLGVESFGAAGDKFDPAMHNAVMHVEDENFKENTICEVFQKGFRVGEKVVRFAMVKVAN